MLFFKGVFGNRENEWKSLKKYNYSFHFFIEKKKKKPFSFTPYIGA